MRTAPLTTVELPSMPQRECRRIELTGRVQGAGVRPAVARLAVRCGIVGLVRNVPSGVEVLAEGSAAAVSAFVAQLAGSLPETAELHGCRSVSAAVHGFTRFEIAASQQQGPPAAVVPPDRAACAACLEEAHDTSQRRFDYGLGSCTDCGPRYSVIEAMPYDRAATAMRGFEPCDACRCEYADPADRRFHAQTIACPKCGPRVWLADALGRTVAGDTAALDAAAAALRAGQVVALKGVGGYQLLVDARSEPAVAQLRQRKRRRSKPLAVMVRSLEAARRVATLDEAEARWLVSAANPIVVVGRRADSGLAESLAPRNPSVGLMLPATPLHARLLARVDFPVVATSGNVEGEPLVYDSAVAERQLAGVADVWLHHGRPIARPIDDSVVRIVAGRLCVLRLARGLAPRNLPCSIEVDQPVLALGGEQKAALAVHNGSQLALGPHIGDLHNSATCQRWFEQLEGWQRLYGVDRFRLAVDLHPNYSATLWAESTNLPRLAVQHHHAHLAAVLLAEQALDRTALGLLWDGAGYGPDGTIWGSECLVGNGRGYQRVARLRGFPLPGGDRTAREPWRVAVAMVAAALGTRAAGKLAWPEVPAAQVRQLAELASRPELHVFSSSMGRLFDAVAALALGTSAVDFEGQAAIELEHVADRAAEGIYPLPWDTSSGTFDWRPTIRAIANDVRRGAMSATVSMRFHRAVARMGAEAAAAHPQLPVVTGGGVFQNALLAELLDEALARHPAGRLHGESIPPGDGGLAAGQLAVALATWHGSARGAVGSGYSANGAR